MVTFGSVVLNVSDIQRASRFWGDALGYTPAGQGNAILRPDKGAGPLLLLDTDDRMHLDLWASDEEEQQAEVERLVSLGASRVDWVYPEDADFVVLSDTEGNLFCVIDAGTGDAAPAESGQEEDDSR
jgi:catechol 2,3-dioxygenase-like lactoylglutathione lyase family enzyme